MNDIWSAEHIQLGISALEDFERFPPHYFQKQPDGKLKFDSNAVNVFSEWTWVFANKPYPFENIIADHDGLIAMKRQLLTLPTFMSFSLTDKSQCLPKSKKYMIFINPKHSVIKEKLEKLLHQCVSISQEEKFFSLEIRFDDAIATLCRKSEAFKTLSVPYDSSFICITNGGQRFQILYRNPWCWIGLFPLALLCGVPYCLCRGCAARDIISQVVANVTLVKHHDHHHSIEHFDNHHFDHDESHHSDHHNKHHEHHEHHHRHERHEHDHHNHHHHRDHHHHHHAEHHHHKHSHDEQDHPQEEKDLEKQNE